MLVDGRFPINENPIPVRKAVKRSPVDFLIRNGLKKKKVKVKKKMTKAKMKKVLINRGS